MKFQAAALLWGDSPFSPGPILHGFFSTFKLDFSVLKLAHVIQGLNQYVNN